ncbi:MAG TPA: group II intron reverse transcriptase/maturase [Desulfobacterales bacterium]|nr:group II intron reverse transcriptase/maturase [Desulfobacterales bacterium]
MTDATISQVLSDANLLQAWYKVKSNDGCAGIDGVYLSSFERNLFSKLALLKDEVLYQTYRPKPLLRVYIPKKSGGMRPLSIPAVRDRVLQTAVSLIITPVFEAEFEECSYAYRRGRSVKMAVEKISQLRDQGFTWVVDADIKSYFDEIDHDRLMIEVKKLITDEEIIRLIKLWLQAVIRDGERIEFVKKGVPQGSPVSPLLANLYLDKFDEAMLGRNFRLIRFSDDFVILCKSKKRAEKAMEFTEQVLQSLKLRINKTKTDIPTFKRGFRFLGVDFIRSLTIKAQYPTIIPEEIDFGTLAEIPAKIPELDGQETSADKSHEILPETSMAEAFTAAGVAPDDFPDTSPPMVDHFDSSPDDGADVKRVNHDPLLRTLYMFTPGVVLGKESERFTIRRAGKVVQRILAIKVDQVMVYGNIQITTQAMQFCIAEKIPIFLLSGHGKFYGIIDGFDTDPVLLHRDQFNRAADEQFCLDLAKALLRGKIVNSRVLLLRQKRRRSSDILSNSIGHLKRSLGKLEKAITLNEIRGYEGSAARVYFQALATLFDPDWRFSGRRKKPPPDPINSLFSYGYTLLYYNLYSLVRGRGLNPHVGFLHPVRPGHPALVSDIIEEFRAIVVDTVVLNLVLNRRIIPDDFTVPTDARQPCLLGERSKSLFVRELEKKLNSRLIYPANDQKLDYRRCMEHQVLHLARVIQGKDETYRPLILR